MFFFILSVPFFSFDLCRFDQLCQIGFHAINTGITRCNCIRRWGIFLRYVVKCQRGFNTRFLSCVNQGLICIWSINSASFCDCWYLVNLCLVQVLIAPSDLSLSPSSGVCKLALFVFISALFCLIVHDDRKRKCSKWYCIN